MISSRYILHTWLITTEVDHQIVYILTTLNVIFLIISYYRSVHVVLVGGLLASKPVRLPGRHRDHEQLERGELVRRGHRETSVWSDERETIKVASMSWREWTGEKVRAEEMGETENRREACDWEQKGQDNSGREREQKRRKRPELGERRGQEREREPKIRERARVHENKKEQERGESESRREGREKPRERY